MLLWTAPQADWAAQQRMRISVAAATCLAVYHTACALPTNDANHLHIWARRHDPWANPHAHRHFTSTSRAFGNRTHFVSYRGVTATAAELDAVAELDLGDCIFPPLQFIWQPNVTEVLRDIRRRGMFLVDLFGYLVNSRTDCRSASLGVCEFKILHSDMQMLAASGIGDHFAGFDIGEKDGNVLSTSAGLTPRGSTGNTHSVRSVRLASSTAERMDEWWRFQHSFELMADDLAFSLTLLDSAYFPHYAAKSGYYMFLGAETAQALPNDQIYYSFIRGAGKQYGINWFGMVSIWNHYAGKQCNLAIACSEDGASLALMRRLMITEILYVGVWFGFEGGMYVGEDPTKPSVSPYVLTPLGQISHSGKVLVESLPVLGAQLTTVALVLDFFTGFAPPRSSNADYTLGHTWWNAGDLWRSWGNLPAEGGDFFAAAVLNLTYPGWADSQYFQNERGFLTPTPYGDIMDVLLTDAPQWLLNRYQLLVVTTPVRTMRLEVKAKLEGFARNGGTLCVSAQTIESVGDLFGVRAFGDSSSVSTIYEGTKIEFNTSIWSNVNLALPEFIDEVCDFEVFDIDTRRAVAHVELAAATSSVPLVYRLRVGNGTLWIFASNGVCMRPSKASRPPLASVMDVPLANPRPLLKHVHLALSAWLAAATPFSAGSNLSVVATAIEGEDHEYVLGISNPHLTQSPLKISSGLGVVKDLREIPLNDVSKVGTSTPGWFPTGYNTTDTGHSTNTTIAGLDVRVFRVAVDGLRTRLLRQLSPSAITLPERRALPLSNIATSLTRAVSSRPTFFDQWSSVVVDWTWVRDRDLVALLEDGRWALRQNLTIMVDFTSGLNGWPDLRLQNNSATELKRSLDQMDNVFRKMGTTVNASVAATRRGSVSAHAIIALHGTPPSKPTKRVDVISSVAQLVEMAHGHGITLHLRVGATTSSEYTRPPLTLSSAMQFLRNVSDAVHLSGNYKQYHANQAANTPVVGLKLMLSVAQLAVQGYNRSTFPRDVLPHVPFPHNKSEYLPSEKHALPPGTVVLHSIHDGLTD